MYESLQSDPSRPNPVANAKYALIDHFELPLMRWGWSKGTPPGNPFPGPRLVEAAIERCDAAIARLATRKGDARVDAARAYLESTRARCADALAAIAEISGANGGFPGGGFTALLARYMEKLVAVAAAQEALARSTTKTVRAARDAEDMAAASLREWLQNDLAELCDRLAWPNPPSPDAFIQAESDTTKLNATARDVARPATLLALALSQGLAAHGDTALLHVVFESSKAQGVLADAYLYRAAIHAESGGAGKAKPIAIAPSASETGSPAAVPYDRSRFDPMKIAIPSHLA